MHGSRRSSSSNGRRLGQAHGGGEVRSHVQRQLRTAAAAAQPHQLLHACQRAGLPRPAARIRHAIAAAILLALQDASCVTATAAACRISLLLERTQLGRARFSPCRQLLLCARQLLQRCVSRMPGRQQHALAL